MGDLREPLMNWLYPLMLTFCIAKSFDEITSAPINGTQADTGLALLAQAVIPDWIGGGLNHSHMVERDERNFALQLFEWQSVDLCKCASDARATG